MALKDDNLGLGAKRGSGQVEGQCTGLDAFQGLLGRLNGKSDGELQKEQDSRDDLKRAIYTERRRGSVRFVRGGLLVGDKLQTFNDSKPADLQVSPNQGRPQQPTASLTKQILRKQQGQDVTRHVGVEPEPPTACEMSTRKTKCKRSTSHMEMNNVANLEAQVVQYEIPYEVPAPSSTSSSAAVSSSIVGSGLASGEGVVQGKEAKAERKRLRAQRNALRGVKRKWKRKAERETSSTTSAWTDSVEISGTVEDDVKAPNVVDHGQSDSGTTVPTQSPIAMFSGGRHAVRRRNIQQKKLAVIDIKALNEVRPQWPDYNDAGH